MEGSSHIISSTLLTVNGTTKTPSERLVDINIRLTLIEAQLVDTPQGTDYLEAQDIQKLFNQQEVITDV